MWEYRAAGKVVDTIPDDSVIMMALLHDICKTHFYGTSTRNQKNDATGKWEKVPYYTCGGPGQRETFPCSGPRRCRSRSSR